MMLHLHTCFRKIYPALLLLPADVFIDKLVQHLAALTPFALAGALSENLAVIVITGGPNSNDFGTNRILHHTTGFADFHQESRCFKEVTCAQVRCLTGVRWVGQSLPCVPKLHLLIHSINVA